MHVNIDTDGGFSKSNSNNKVCSLSPNTRKRDKLFYGFWNDAMRKEIYSSGHNGYLDTIIDTGFCGLIFLATFLISNCRKAQTMMTQDFDWGVLWFCFLLMTVVHNIAESSATSLTGSLTAILLFMSMCSEDLKEKQTEVNFLSGALQ